MLAQPTSRYYLLNTERVYLKVTIEKEHLAGINFSDLDIITMYYIRVNDERFILAGTIISENRAIC